MTEQINVEELSPEARAALAEFDEMAAGEAPPPGPDGRPVEEPAPPPTVDLAAEFDGLAEVVVSVLAVQVPVMLEIWAPEKRRAAAAAAAAVCNKRGWLQGGIVGGMGEELALLLTLGPLVLASYKAIKEAADKKPETVAAPGVAAAAGDDLAPVSMLARG